MPNYLDTSTKLEAIRSAAKAESFQRGDPAVKKVPGNSNLTESDPLGNTLSAVDDPDKLKKARNFKANQDFEELKAKHSSENLFFDAEFPAEDSSIGFDKTESNSVEKIEWLRPREIIENPKLFVNGSSRFDVIQAKLGDCWFLSALSVLGDRPDLLSRVVPQCETYLNDCVHETKSKSCVKPDCRVFDNANYAGIFHFRFWQNDSWVDVVIDDRLPTVDDRRLKFAQSSVENEFWVALVEKAYAKLKGSYEALKSGFSTVSFTDLTGGKCFSYYLDNQEFRLIKTLKEAKRKNALIAFSTMVTDDLGVDAKSEKSEMTSISRSHCYSFVKYFSENPKSNWVKLRNPWGRGEWSGVGSDDWVKEYLRCRSPSELSEGWNDFKKSDDGEFHMRCDDVNFFFECVDVCYPIDYVPSSNDTSHIKSTKVWDVRATNGKWVPRIKAPGPYIDKGENTFSANPRYVVTLNRSSNEVNVRLRQNVLGIDGDLLSTGLSIFKVNSDGSKRTHIATKFEADEAKKIIHLRLKLGNGTYEIVPFTAKIGQSGKFTLRVACNRRINEFKVKSAR